MIFLIGKIVNKSDKFSILSITETNKITEHIPLNISTRFDVGDKVCVNLKVSPTRPKIFNVETAILTKAKDANLFCCLGYIRDNKIYNKDGVLLPTMFKGNTPSEQSKYLITGRLTCIFTNGTNKGYYPSIEIEGMLPL